MLNVGVFSLRGFFGGAVLCQEGVLVAQEAAHAQELHCVP